MTDELPQRVRADVFTERLPVVQTALDPAAAAAQHALGPAPLFDPDRVAPFDPVVGHAAAAVELHGDELADELAAQCPGRAALLEQTGDLEVALSSSGWFEPAVPGALVEHGTQVPTAAALQHAAQLLAEHRHHAAAAWVDTWAAAAR